MKKLFLYKSLLMIICLLGAAACGDGKKKEEALIGKSDEKNTVDYCRYDGINQTGSFQKQIVCNGKLRAVVKSDLAFRVRVITAIHIRNGDRVAKGNDVGSA